MLKAFASAVAALSQPMGSPSRRTIAKRAELTAAWRWVAIAPLKFRHNGQGPRPASTYRAARRNARRWMRRAA